MAKDLKISKPLLAAGKERSDQLTHDLEMYFEPCGGQLLWPGLSESERQNAALELNSYECVVTGKKANEGAMIKLVEVGTETGCIPGPWNYVPFENDESVKEDHVSEYAKAFGNKIRVVHFDPLDEKAGLEVMDIENRTIRHGNLAFYRRPPRDKLKIAKSWEQDMGLAWLEFLRLMYKFVSTAAAGNDPLKTLGYKKVADWMDMHGMSLPKLGDLLKLFDSPFGFVDAWDENSLNPFLAAAVDKKAKEKAGGWVAKVTEAGTSRDRKNEITIKDLMDQLKNAFPPEPSEKKWLIIQGTPKYQVVQSVEEPSHDVLAKKKGMVVQGVLAWEKKQLELLD